MKRDIIINKVLVTSNTRDNISKCSKIVYNLIR